jgi:hypothetical protein
MHRSVVLLACFIALCGCKSAAPNTSPGGQDGSTADASHRDGPGGDGATAGFPAKASGGTRLKALFARTPDGEKYHQFVFYDTQLKVRCAWGVAQDGKDRCLPLPPAVSSRNYSDSACTQALLPADDACADGYVRRVADGLVSIFRLGAPITTTAYVRYASAGGGVPDGGASSDTPADAGRPPDAGATVSLGAACVLDSSVAGQKFFTTGAPVPPETFALFDPPHPIMQPGHRIVPLGHTGADGSKERLGWWDTKYNQQCAIDVAGDGERRCLPYQFLGYPTTYFSDAACTQAVAPSLTTKPPSPYFVRTIDSKVCPTRATYYLTEPLPANTSAFRKTSTGCIPMMFPATVTLYALKGALAPGELDKFTDTLEGTGRLRRRVQTSTDGTVDGLSNPYDSKFSDQCRFGRTPDGMLRCVPYVNGRIDVFADTACHTAAAQPGGAFSTPGGPLGSLCGLPPQSHATTVSGPWCAPIVEVHALGATQGTWQHSPTGTCEPALGIYYPVGAAADANDFVAAEEIME